MLVLLVCLLAAKNYNDYVLYKVFNPSKELAQQLSEYDIWSESKTELEVFMPSRDFEALNVPSSQIVKEDIPELIDGEAKRLTRNKRFKQTPPVTPDDVWFEQFFVDYSPYDQVQQWYKKLSEQFPELVKFVPSIGKSLEGRDLFAVHITAPTTTPKKQFYFESLIHAREWISGTTTAYIAWQLIKGYTNKDTTFVNILNQAEFVIVPIVNPDGYNHAHTKDRMWRKNTRTVRGRIAGVDLNRNFQDGHWGQGGSSSNPGSETYMGTAPFSEPETAAIDKYFRGLDNVVGAIDFHSYSQLILRPYGFTEDDSPNESDFKKVTAQMSASIQKVSSKYYTPEKSVELYITTGTASDYFYVARPSQKEWIFALTIELRPNNAWGSGGFVLSPKEIIPTGKETLAGLLDLINFKLESA